MGTVCTCRSPIRENSKISGGSAKNGCLFHARSKLYVHCKLIVPLFLINYCLGHRAKYLESVRLSTLVNLRHCYHY